MSAFDLFTPEAELEEARRRRDEGAKLAEHSVDTRWRLAAEAAIRRLAQSHLPFSADDLRSIVGTPLGSPNAIGSLFLNAAREGVIEHVGFTVSTRPEARCRPIRTWRGVPYVEAA